MTTRTTGRRSAGVAMRTPDPAPVVTAPPPVPAPNRLAALRTEIAALRATGADDTATRLRLAELSDAVARLEAGR